MAGKSSVRMIYQGEDNKTKMIVDAANKNTDDILHDYVTFNNKNTNPFDGDIDVTTKSNVKLHLVRTNYQDPNNGSLITYRYSDRGITILEANPAIQYYDTFINSKRKYLTFDLGLNGMEPIYGNYTIKFKVTFGNNNIFAADNTKMLGIFLTTDYTYVRGTRIWDYAPAAGDYDVAHWQAYGTGNMQIATLDETDVFGNYYPNKTFSFTDEHSVVRSIDYSYLSFKRTGTEQREYSVTFSIDGEELGFFKFPYFTIVMEDFIDGHEYSTYVADGEYWPPLMTIRDIRCEYDKGDHKEYIDGIDIFHNDSWHPMRNPGSDIHEGAVIPEPYYGKESDLFIQLDNPETYFNDSTSLSNLDPNKVTGDCYSIGTTYITNYNNDKSLSGLLPPTAAFSYTGYNVRTATYTVPQVNVRGSSASYQNVEISVNNSNFLRFKIQNLPLQTEVHFTCTIQYSTQPIIDTITNRYPQYEFLEPPFGSDYYNNRYSKGNRISLNLNDYDHIVTPSEVANQYHTFSIDTTLSTKNSHEITGILDVSSINNFVYNVDSNGLLPEGVSAVTSLPDPSWANNGKIFYYIGENVGTSLIYGRFYLCTFLDPEGSSGSYSEVAGNLLGYGYNSLAALSNKRGSRKTVYIVNSGDTQIPYYWDDVNEEYTTTPNPQDLFTITVKDLQIEYISSFNGIYYRYNNTWLRNSSGGTNVEANPSDQATDSLTKLKVGDTTYSVSQQGGGSVEDVKVDNVSVVDQNGVANINTMTGAGSSSAGAKGLVPAPSSGDDTKFLSGDGTWKTVSSGASSISALTDVTLNSLSNGQILKYNSATSQWENSNESGGGGGSSSEIISITGGTNTSSRTFEFSATPKRITVSYDSADSNPWIGHWDFIWGDDVAFGFANAKGIPGTGATICRANITYGADDKSFTVTGSNAFQAWNQSGSVRGGRMYVEY